MKVFLILVRNRLFGQEYKSLIFGWMTLDMCKNAFIAFHNARDCWEKEFLPNNGNRCIAHLSVINLWWFRNNIKIF